MIDSLTSGSVLAVVLGGTLLYSLVRQRCQKSSIDPCPLVDNAHCFFGHWREAWDTPDAHFYLYNFRKHGQVFRMKAGLFQPDILVLSDPAAVSHLFHKDCDVYQRGKATRSFVQRIFGHGSLFWTEGPEHKIHKQPLLPFFTHESIKQLSSDINSICDRYVDGLRKHVESQSTKEPVDVSINDWTWRATLDIIGHVAFGHDFDFGKSAEAQMISESMRDIAALDGTLAGCMGPMVLRVFPSIAKLPLKALDAPGETRRIVRRLATRIVEARRAMSQQAAPCEKDFLSTMMSECHGENLDSLLDDMAGFVMAGYETTAGALNYTVYALSRDLGLQKALRRELLEFKSSDPSSSEPTYEDYLAKLPLMDAICKEGLRLYAPPAPTERIATRDDVLPLQFPVLDPVTKTEITSVRVQKGQVIIYPYLAFNRSELIWGPDADKFNPKRWLNPDHALPSHGWNGQFTFAYGARMCIGMRLALYEFKAVLSALVKSFEFLPSSKGNMALYMSAIGAQQPYIIGTREKGGRPSVPVRVRCILEEL